MLRSLKPRTFAATITGLSVSFALGCSEPASPTSVHGNTPGTTDGRANTIQVVPAAVSAEEGVKSTLACSAMDSRGVVLSASPTWSSSNESVATVNSAGAVLAQRPGNATITCSLGGKTASSTVTVATSPIAFIEVTPGAGTLEVGNSIQLSGIPRDAQGGVVSGRSVQFVTADTDVATVSSTGAVTARLEGTANVIAMSGGKASLARINVSNKPVLPVSSLLIKVDDATLTVGKFTHITVTTLDAGGSTLNGRAVTWSVSDPSVASVVALNADKATVTGLSQGTTTVTATSEGKSASVSITVGAPATATPVAVSTVSVSLNSANILPGETSQATATVKDASGNVLTDRVVTWSSLDPSIAVVSQTGLVTAMASGAVIIRATSETKTGDASLTVGVPPVAEVVVNLATSTLAPGQTTQASAVAKDASGHILTGKSIAWSSSNTAIATVSIYGVVTSKTTGSAAIRATVESTVGDGMLTVASTTPTPAPVATVTVSLGSSSLTPGQTTQASAVARDASDNVLTGRTIVWTSLTPSVATVSTTGLVTAVAAGSATIRATVETKTGDGALAVTAPVTLAPQPPAPSSVQLPQVFLTTTVASTPSDGRILRVPAGADLQRALDTAVAGDKILLAAGATFTGNFILRDRTGAGTAGGWITVQTDGAMPAEGTRAAPTTSFPKIVSPNVLPAIATNGPAKRWRIMGVEITVAAGQTYNQGLIALGCPNNCETSLAEQPSDIVFDRVYAHGYSSLDMRRCFGFNAARLSLVDSYVSECHSTFDAQAVGGWNGPGPFKIVNNYLEGAAENVAFGGATPAIANLVPSDIEIRRNHIIKPMTWKGSQWLVKNLIEFKSIRRVLLEGNVLENSWPQGQAGFAFVLWSANSGCSWCTSEDITVRSNVIRNVAAAFNLTGRYDGTTARMRNVSISNNVVIGLDNPNIGGNGRVFQIADSIANLSIEHNTAFSPSNSSFIWGGVMPNPNHVIRNNLTGGGQYQIFTSYGSGEIAWDHAAGVGSSFVNNAVVGYPGWVTPIPNNWYPGSFDDLGFVGGGSAATSPNATLSQLTLSATSGYKGKATDGTDPGADISALSSAISGVVQTGASLNVLASSRGVMLRQP